MNKKTMATALALCMLAMSFAPSGSADACDESGADCYKKTATGPGGISDKELFAAGVGFCLAAGLPLPCVGGGGGGVFYDISSYNTNPSSPSEGLLTRVWAEWIGGGVNLGEPFEGFEMTVCSDRDDNLVCSPNVDSPDDYVTTYAHDPEDGNGKFCDDTKGKYHEGDFKDDDKCGNGLVDGEVRMCVNKDLPDPLDESMAREWDDLVVFIGAYTSVSQIQDLNFGLSSGQFDIYLEVLGFSDPCAQVPARINGLDGAPPA